uniref:MICOS complex subunit MIC13 isoform X2 n=1 Tax=Panthera onca TaxID=9690 RepID=UPI002955A71E|nr:MICOS complex subunit MIC13 isoform X2 [Panthera onca]
MVPRVWSLMRFLIKGSVAGGAVYLVYDQELLGPSDKSQAVLQKAEELPAPPKFNFHIRDSWNSAQVTISWFVSSSPTSGFTLTEWSLLGMLTLSFCLSLPLPYSLKINLKKKKKAFENWRVCAQGTRS